MGSRVARRLLDGGYELIVWNRTPEKASDLVAAGANLADSPVTAAREAEVVITMVADPDALRDVTERPEEIAAGVSPSSTVIEMSTVGPDAVNRLASALPEGVGLLDAPVLGSRSEAEAGTLQIFVGGPAPLFERWRDLLSQLGSPIHVGPLGSGAAAKLVANSTLVGTISLFGEALALADALELSRMPRSRCSRGRLLANRRSGAARRSRLETSRRASPSTSRTRTLSSSRPRLGPQAFAWGSARPRAPGSRTRTRPRGASATIPPCSRGFS
jgi:3-hydroxyisobutyrate dehydrogenase-like beta-hydroxyacid dehydrogenase